MLDLIDYGLIVKTRIVYLEEEKKTFYIQLKMADKCLFIDIFHLTNDQTMKKYIDINDDNY